MKKLLLAFVACASFVCAQNLRASDAPVYHEALIKSIGKNAVSVSGDLDPATLKTKKYLFVYYSAHWCPPCRKFTPKLVEFYNKNHANGDFDLIFVSSDKGQREMNDYMKGEKMPWIGLKLDSKPARALKKLRRGTGIPCLILIDETGKVISQSYDENNKYTGPYTALRAYEKIKKDK
ncbi:thioredoxin-like domain-containing protein [Ereboglobus luteus]|uniref:Thioredoxin domain-containing protein n=1 Tax=Ereboglobus luteus TaxID=1796921 RepID=A0A2U8E3S0_9BACT|nr:thioredoxin-like domain-containing protein [Ereboglobus luteus]AWI09547.1 hypothetical protein CKA38_10095 [Ereboglobus luteus]